jgi:2,5-furandicarboxylate decarboxylase 1
MNREALHKLAAISPVLGNRDLLDFLQSEHPNEIFRVKDVIDPKECEHAGFEQLFRDQGRHPWIIFEQAVRADGKKWDGLFATCNFNSFSLMALAYGLDLKKSRPFDLILKHYHGMTHPAAPQRLEKKEAPVKRVVLRGDEARLDLLPIFRNCARDARPGWLAPMWAVRGEDGRYNLSWHRSWYVNEREITLRFYPGRHLWDEFQRYAKKKQPMPAVAIIGGHHPAFAVGCGTAFNLAVDEYEAVGGIYKTATGHELRVTDSELWGKEMLVPADAEIILEGYITERQAEAGLWCDAWQNYTPPSKQNVFRVEALTMREQPLFVSNWPGASVQTSLSGAAEVYGLLRPHFREIRGINFPFVQTVIVSCKLPARGLGVNIGATLYAMKQNMKHVIIVDEDVDPYDFQQVFFAMTSRVDAGRDVQIINVGRHPNDPAGDGSTIGGMIIDATRPRDSDAFEIARPSPDALEKAQAVLDREALDHLPTRPALSW